MNKAEKLVKQHPTLGIALLILILIEVLKLFILVWITIAYYGHHL